MKGKIEFVKEKEGKRPYGIKISGTWYNTYELPIAKTCRDNLNSLIDFEYETNEKGFHTLTKVDLFDKVSQPEPPQEKIKVDWDAKDLKIVRQNAMSQANQMLSTLQAEGRLKEISNQDIKKLFFDFAQECEKFVYE